MSVVATMTTAGLCAYGVPRSKRQVTTFLLDVSAIPDDRRVGAQGHPLPKHLPLLVIHRRHLGTPPGFLRNREVDLKKHVQEDWLDENPAAYYGWDITDCDLSIAEHERKADLEFSKAKRPGSCPINGDWSSLQWLVTFNQLNRSTINQRSPVITTRVDFRRGLFQATRPVERNGEDVIFKLGRARQVFTDAAQARWRAEGDNVTLRFRRGVSGDLPLDPNRGAVNVLVLNLPDQDGVAELPHQDPGEHFTAFYEILKSVPAPSRRTLPKDTEKSCGGVPLGGSYCMAPIMAV
jgi:hypothetical protein